MVPALVVRILVGVIASLGTLRFGTGVYFWRVTEALERPSYTVIAKLSDGVEIRQYDPYLIAETIVDGVGFREPTSQGFRACASYIFGKNRKAKTGWFSTTSSVADSSEKMAMTAPVRVTGDIPGSDQDTSGLKRSKVSFVIGNQYSLKTAPKPLDKSVKVRQVPSHTLAVKTFSGPPPNDSRVRQERVKIEQALVQDNRAVPGPNEETIVYGYHDPFITPNFLRRNEVALLIDGTI